MIRVDGSRGEGGGQVLRSALALSACLREDVEVENVRAARPKPGLRPQHLAVVRGLAEICDAEVEGAEIGSRLLTFRPRETRRGEFVVDAGTAGSVVLMLQGVLPAALKRGARLILRGGTDVPMAPTMDYLSDVFFPLIVGSGVLPRWTLVHRGLAPSGGGQLIIEVPPTRLKEFALPPAEARSRIDLKIAYAHLPDHVPARIRGAFEAEMERGRGRSLGDPEYGASPPEVVPTRDVGVAATAVSYGRRVLGASALGERGRVSEDIGRALARSLLDDLSMKADVDEHAADQLLLYGALAPPMEFEVRVVTEHLKTNAEVVEKITGVKVKFEKRGSGATGARIRVG